MGHFFVDCGESCFSTFSILSLPSPTAHPRNMAFGVVEISCYLVYTQHSVRIKNANQYPDEPAHLKVHVVPTTFSHHQWQAVEGLMKTYQTGTTEHTFKRIVGCQITIQQK